MDDQRPSDEELKRRVHALNTRRDPEELMRRIAELEAQLNAAQAHTTRPEAHEPEEAKGAAPQAEQGSTDSPVANTPQLAKSASPAQGEGKTGLVGDKTAPDAGIISSVANQQQTRPNIVESGGTSIAHMHDDDLRLQSATELCQRVSEGESMNAICKDVDMPSRGTFLRWCRDDPRISALYADALRMRAAHYADELIELSDRAEGCTEAAEVQALKLMVNTRQWVASRLLPKMYGDHQIVEHTGEVKLDEAQVDARLNHLLKRIQRSG